MSLQSSEPKEKARYRFDAGPGLIVE
jgi:hypothetical protein